jgi:hypothetical protein
MTISAVRAPASFRGPFGIFRGDTKGPDRGVSREVRLG